MGRGSCVSVKPKGKPGWSPGRPHPAPTPPRATAPIARGLACARLRRQPLTTIGGGAGAASEISAEIRISLVSKSNVHH